MAKVAIMGFGTVGSGVLEIIKQNSDTLKIHANGEPIEMSKILDIRDFSDNEDAGLFTKDFNDILSDASIDVVAEVMGGLHPAYEYTKELLLAGKSVVTSNKELVATYGTELLKIACDNNVNYLFEASVGGGIPVIRPIHQCLTANKVEKIAGILNGTTNYILNEMIKNGKTFEAALSDAQAKGYAEKNPAADIEGHDACRKIAILASLASGKYLDYKNITTEGIVNISLSDVKYAEKYGKVIKLIGYADFDIDGKVFSIVCPMLIDAKHPLACVDDVFNAIMITGNCVGDVMFYGKGAGKLPTASAVVADIIDAVKHKERAKRIAWKEPTGDFLMSADKKSFSFFIRTTSSIEDAKKIFDIEDVWSIGEQGENAFVTKPLPESEIHKKLMSLDGVISYIRVME